MVLLVCQQGVVEIGAAQPVFVLPRQQQTSELEDRSWAGRQAPGAWHRETRYCRDLC